MSRQPSGVVFDPWGQGGPAEALGQIRNLLAGKWPGLGWRELPDGRITSESPGPPGVPECQLVPGADEIKLTCVLVRAPGTFRHQAMAILEPITQIGREVTLAVQVDQTAGAGGRWTLEASVPIKAEPLTIRREAALISVLCRLESACKRLHLLVPPPVDDHHAIKKLLDPLGEKVEAVLPWGTAGMAQIAALDEWARETYDCWLKSGSQVAVYGGADIVIDLALSRLAREAQADGTVLAKLNIAAIPPKAVPEIVRAAPPQVILVVPAGRVVNGGNSLYELGHEAQAMVSQLAQMHRPVVFVGAPDQLQQLCGATQGARPDPLTPVLREIPRDIDRGTMVSFAVDGAAQRHGGLSVAVVADVVADVKAATGLLEDRLLQRIVAPVVERAVREAAAVKPFGPQALRQMVETLVRTTATFSGLTPTARAGRDPHLQAKLRETLLRPDVLARLEATVFGQTEALTELVETLRVQAFNKPNTPIGYLAQGTPGSGKSISAERLADILSVPFLALDATAPDPYSFSTSMRGQSRGIVGSYQQGEMEKIAKATSGCVVEIADADRAPPAVRYELAKLFLPILDQGVFSTATGAQLPIPNAIFAFTVNLPEGRDEAIRRGGIGIRTAPPSERSIGGDVDRELCSLFSNAFRSRVGRPILFKPLSREVLARIMQRQIESSIAVVASQFCMQYPVLISPDLSATCISITDYEALSQGARTLKEQGATLATSALMRAWYRHGETLRSGQWQAVAVGGRIEVVPADRSA